MSSKSRYCHWSYTTPDCHEPTFDFSYTTLSRPTLRCLNLLSLTAAKPNWSGTASDWYSYTRWNAERSSLRADSTDPMKESEGPPPVEEGASLLFRESVESARRLGAE